MNIEVYKTKSKGWGARTLEDVPANKFVCEYAGEVLPYKEAKHRAHQNTKDSSYMIVLREHSSDEQILRMHIDPRYYGNVGRFFNHSCDPNLFMVAVRGDSFIPKLALFTRRFVKAGEELCFDYSGQIASEHHSGESITPLGGPMRSAREQKRSVGPHEHQDVKRTSCACGAANCRGFLPNDESLYT